MNNAENFEKAQKLRFRIVDVLLIIGMIAPLVVGMALKILFTPASDGIEIKGALIYFTIPMPLQDLPITESQVNTWLLIISVFFLCLFFTHGTKVKFTTIRQNIAEMIIEKLESFVTANMGAGFIGFAPFIASVMALSAFSSLLTLIGLYPPTSDFNVIAGWSLLVFILITHYKMKCGPLYYLRGLTKPIVVFTPINIISEVATPVAMTFRHYGNILSGTVISVLIAFGLQSLSALILGKIPVIGSIPFLQIGIPAVLSIYFDVFSGCLQAFIFAMLTMLYVSQGFPAEDYAKKLELKKQKQKIKNEN